MNKIIKAMFIVVILLPSLSFSQAITFKKFYPALRLPPGYFLSIAIMGDSVLVPADKIDILQISNSGDWKKVWFDFPAGLFISTDSQKHVWFMSNEWDKKVLLVEYDWNSVKSYSYSRPRGGEHLIAFGIDQHNNKWIVSDDEGMYRLNDFGWTKYDTTNSSIKSNHCTGIYFNNVNDEVWVNVNRTMVFTIFNGTSWRTLKLDTTLLPNPNSLYLFNVVFDSKGFAWISLGYGLYLFNGNSLKKIQPPNEVTRFYGLGLDKNDNKWLTANDTSHVYMFKYNDSTWTKYRLGTDQINLWDGRIWIDKYGQKWGMDGATIWVFNENGLISDVNEPNLIKPTTFSLEQNYPNPFNPTTTIEYQVPKQSKVVVRVMDLLGREIETLVNEEKSAGNYSVKFDGRHYSSGVYFYQLIANGNVITKKFVLMK